MCNFVIRPIKSYATVDYFEEKSVNGGEQTELVKRGEFVEVRGIHVNDVFGFLNGDKENPVTIPLESFIHGFTADTQDIYDMMQTESSWFPKKAKENKAEKKSEK